MSGRINALRGWLSVFSRNARMTDAEANVAALYRGILGRQPDTAGLAHWTRVAEATNDLSVVATALRDSEELQPSAAWNDQQGVLLDSIRTLMHGRRITIVDVGAQELVAEQHVYKGLTDHGLPYRVIGFEPLEEKGRARERIEGATNLTMLPYAVTDGGARVLYVNNEDSTSSLFPLDTEFCAAFEHLNTLREVAQIRVEGRTLDDALRPGPVEFLKLDVQGAELMVLRGAARTLRNTAVVHCEVEFAPIYKGQDLYPSIQILLNDAGFELIDLIISHRYSYVTESKRRSPDRLLWADAVFFKLSDDPETLAAQALIAATVYGKLSLCEHLLSRII